MWDKRHHNSTKKILKELSLYAHKDGVKYSPRVQILMRELIALSNGDMSEAFVIRVLIALKKSNKRSLTSFEETYKVQWNERQQREKTQWEIFLPHNNEITKKHFSILGLPFSIISLKHFTKELITRNYLKSSTIIILIELKKSLKFHRN